MTTDSVSFQEEQWFHYPQFRERADGPRYVEAVREGRRLRERAAAGWESYTEQAATLYERTHGIPEVSWWPQRAALRP